MKYMGLKPFANEIGMRSNVFKKTEILALSMVIKAPGAMKEMLGNSYGGARIILRLNTETMAP